MGAFFILYGLWRKAVSYIWMKKRCPMNEVASVVWNLRWWGKGSKVTGGANAAHTGNMANAEYVLVENEIMKAHSEWELACKRLDYALGEDEIDYAVFMLEAAEKRYGMLLRRAKQLYGEQTQWDSALKLEQEKRAVLRDWKEGKGWSEDG